MKISCGPGSFPINPMSSGRSPARVRRTGAGIEAVGSDEIEGTKLLQNA